MAKEKNKKAVAAEPETLVPAPGFDPNAPGNPDAGIYGLPFDTASAKLVIVPVPWEVTVSYSAGTAHGPAAILDASFQVDLYDEDYGNFWQAGIAMDDISRKIMKQSDALRKKACKVIDAIEKGEDPAASSKLSKVISEVNEGCENMVNWVKEKTGRWLDEGKAVALLGGDHSTPLGFIHALAERNESFAILQIDAHADLRDAFEGFTYSHASIMFNALKVSQVSKLVQVGIRDYCESEAQIMNEGGRVKAFTGRALDRMQIEGQNWKSICDKIVKELPEKVYISFDIDGLDPTLCPHTGTPVPGGLSYEQALYLLRSVVESGKKVIGFDLNEVAPGGDDWDGNVGARLLYRMCGLLMRSKGIA